MNGRDRVAAAAHADQPRIRWQLDERRSSRIREMWRHIGYVGGHAVFDGYEVEVHYGRTSDRSISSAKLIAPGGVRPAQIRLFRSDRDKAEKVATWFAAPAAAVATERAGIRI